MSWFFTTPDGNEGLFVAQVLRSFLARWQSARININRGKRGSDNE